MSDLYPRHNHPIKSKGFHATPNKKYRKPHQVKHFGGDWIEVDAGYRQRRGNVPVEETSEFKYDDDDDDDNNNKENTTRYMNKSDKKNKEDSTAQSLNEHGENKFHNSSQTQPPIKGENELQEEAFSEKRSNSWNINLTAENLNEAFYFPKKLTDLYKYLFTQQQYQNHILNNIYITKWNQHRANPPFNSHPTTPFSYNDNYPIQKKLTFQPHNSYMGLNNISIGNTLSNTIKGSEWIDPKKENTDVLSINIKVNSSEVLNFKIRRYDDMFKTVKIFCEINQLDTKYIKSLIIYIIKAFNGIYRMMNTEIGDNNIERFRSLQKESSVCMWSEGN